MDVKSAFLYGNITEEVYVNQPLGFEYPHHPIQSPYKEIGAIDKTLLSMGRKEIMMVQVYVDDIIFRSTKTSMKTIKPATTPIEAHKALGKNEEGETVDVHLIRSMIGCLMYLTASRPDIMFVVYNESTICIVKNPVFHSKTKHIQIRHHFIRDCYDQRLINVVKVQLFGSQYWNDEPIATFKGRTACQVWTLKEAMMLFLRGVGFEEMLSEIGRFCYLIMAIMNSCNKHNMIACVEKTERNADFHDVIDFLTGCSVNYALLVSPDVIQ
ncbi:hypothetical protein Tco_0754339 [Tanacetum coccineum]